MLLTEWLDAAAVSAQEIASGPLGASSLKWDGPLSTKLPTDLCGVYIPLLTEGVALQMGVLGTREVCTSLARSLLGEMEGEAPVESDADVFDAVGEVTNLIAGNVKVLLADKGVAIKVGVPLAMRGRVFPLGGSKSIHGSLVVDDRAVWLVMQGSKSS